MTTTINASSVKIIGAEIDAAIAEVLERHGLEAAPRRIGYDATGFKYSVQISVVNLSETGVNLSSTEAQGWLLVASMRGFADRDAAKAALGTTFTSQGRTFVFLGYKTRSPKRPILARCQQDGKTYVFSDATCRLLQGYDAASDYTRDRTAAYSGPQHGRSLPCHPSTRSWRRSNATAARTSAST
jgi:hypothetical protein